MEGGGILLVEDDPVDAASVRRACAKAGITRPIEVVRDGREAMAYLRRQNGQRTDPRFPEGRPRLILLDLNLPLMSGLELLAELKSHPVLRRIPVVVLSTSSRERDVSACFDRGVAGYFVKPLKFNEFVRAMDAIERYWALSKLCSETCSAPTAAPRTET